MISATLSVGIDSIGRSLRALIDTATPGQLTAFFTNRVFEVVIQFGAGTSYLVYKSGSITVATDTGFVFNSGDDILTLRSPTGNQISLADIYLAGDGLGPNTVRVLANTL